MARLAEDLARRLREVRVARYGAEGVAALAEALRLPPLAWRNYEAGVTIPGPVLLQFIEVTGADPRWLLNGRSPQFSPGRRAGRAFAPSDN